MLVHGWNGWPVNWRPIAAGLRAGGWEPFMPRLPFRPWSQTIRHDAGRLQHFLQTTLYAGRPLVEWPLVLVGYSRGGLVNRSYFQLYGSAGIRAAIDIGVPHLGSPVASLKLLRPVVGAMEMAVGSELVQWLTGGIYPPANCPHLAICGRASAADGYNDLIVWEESATLGGRLQSVTIDLRPKTAAWHGNLINRSWLPQVTPHFCSNDLAWPQTLGYITAFLQRLAPAPQPPAVL